jgi:transcriptional regulator with XRE-family HTH domain
MNLEVNKRIRKYREEKKVSQEKVGRAIGMKCNAYSRMEREGNISVADALGIADALAVDPDLIIYGEIRHREPLFTPIEPKPIIARDPFAEEPKIYTRYVGDEFELSVEEKAMIEIFRNRLSEEDKNKIREICNGK